MVQKALVALEPPIAYSQWPFERSNSAPFLLPIVQASRRAILVASSSAPPGLTALGDSPWPHNLEPKMRANGYI